MPDIALDWGPKTSTDWSVISWHRRPPDTIAHKAPAHIVLIQLSAFNERHTATASDRFRFYRPTRGAIELIPNEADHKAAWEHSKNSLFFGFRAEMLALLAEREFGRASIDIVAPPLGTMDTYILHLAEVMRQHFTAGSLLADLQVDAVSTLLAIHVLQNYSSRAIRPQARRNGGLRAGAKRAVLEFLESRIAEGVTVTELAEVSGLSVSHFMRAFKAEFGMTPHRYLLDRRMEAAARMLRSTTLPLVQIALDAGFASQSHMNAAFTRLRGMTPGGIRRQQ